MQSPSKIGLQCSTVNGWCMYGVLTEQKERRYQLVSCMATLSGKLHWVELCSHTVARCFTVGNRGEIVPASFPLTDGILSPGNAKRLINDWSGSKKSTNG